MYERYCKIRDLKGYKDSDVANLAGITKSTFSDWKSGRSKPKDGKMQSIANALGVTFEYLKGKTNKIWCPECEMHYDPLDAKSADLHEQIHSNYINAISKYGFCYSSDKCQEDVYCYMNMLSSPPTDCTNDDIAYAYIKYLEIEFSSLLRQSNYNLKYDSFDDYVREQVIEDANKTYMTHAVFTKLAKKYHIDTEYIGESDLLLAKVSKNDQYLRMLKYMELLRPEMLDAIEIQMKALAEQNEKE